MAWTKPTTITAWSFSRYNGYRKCPLAFKLGTIDKINEPSDPNGPMARGDRIHKLADAYIKGTVAATIPDELALFPKFFKRVRKIFAKTPHLIAAEETWAFRKDWTRTTWNDWNGCWLRIKLDCAFLDKDTVFVVDFKTGKFSPQYNVQEYMEQLELYALGALMVYGDDNPNIKVIPALYYLDHEIIHPDPETPMIYTMADRERLKKEWEKRVKPLFADKTFAPKPGSNCRWCWYGQAKKSIGGPGLCKF